MDESFAREPEVRETFGFGGPRTTYDMVADCLLPPPVLVGRKTVGWPRSEIRRLVAARLAGLPNTKVRRLVREMVRRRADAFGEQIHEMK